MSLDGDSRTEESGSALTLPRVREMTDTHAVLWTVIVVTTVADILLTLTGLTAGLQEGNLLVRALMGELGVAGLWVIKFGAMVWLVTGWALLSDRNATIFLGLFAVVTLGVVVHNAIVVLGI